MELIIGGAYQGKLSYAVEKYDIGEAELFDLSDGLPERSFRCFFHLESLTRAAAERGLSAQELADTLLPLFGESVVISREVGCGIVPTDASERLFRELHGSVLRILAREASSVTRIFCGLPERLK